MVNLGTLVAFSALTAGTDVASTKPLNVVALVIDDLGWTDVSYHGSVFPTPNIDDLAKTGVRLERYYVQPVCSPTRSAIVSGRWPHKMGTQHFTTIGPGTEAHVPRDDEPARSKLPQTKIISELLKSQGYSTHAIGKWHLGYSSWDYCPPGRGFDSYTGYLQGAVDYFDKTFSATGVIAPKSPIPLKGLDFWQNETVFYTSNTTYALQYYQAAFDAAISNHVAAGEDTKPFFIYYAIQLVHEPLQIYPPETDGGKAKAACAHISGGISNNRNILCQMAAALDLEVGRVVTSLKTNNLWENTVIWATTDNGGMVDYKLDASPPTSASSNWPLRGGKATLFEGGVRGVAFVNGGALPEYLDGLDGINAWGIIADGEKAKRTEIVLNINPKCHACTAIPPSPYADFVPGIATPGDKPADYSALIQGDWKIILGYPGIYDGWWENNASTYTRLHPPPRNDTNVSVRLYNMRDDGTEHFNVAPNFPDIVKQLRDRIRFHEDPKNGYLEPQLEVPHPDSVPALHNGTWSPWQKKEL